MFPGWNNLSIYERLALLTVAHIMHEESCNGIEKSDVLTKIGPMDGNRTETISGLISKGLLEEETGGTVLLLLGGRARQLYP